MVRGKNNKRAVLVTLSAALLASPIGAQTPNSPVTGNIALTTDIVYDTNPNLTAGGAAALSLSETLSFGFLAETPTQVFSVSTNMGVTWDQVSGGGTTLTVNDPTLNLSYSRDGANSRFNAGLGYWTGDVTSAFDNDPTSAVNIVVDTGTLTRTNANLGLAIGTNGPLGLALNASTDRRTYAGTSDPALFDNEDNVLGLTASLRFSPTTDATLSVTRSEYSADDAASTESQTMDYGFGITHQLASALTIDGTLGYRTIDTQDISGSSTRNGYYASLNATQLVNNGTFSAGVAVDTTGPADRTSLTLGRTLDLPDGTISASLTATDIQGRVRLTGNAAYTKQLPTGSIDLALTQSINTNQQSEDILFSQLSLGYSQQVNTIAGLSLQLDLSRSEDGGAGAAPTQNRATLKAAYNQALTPDWDLSVGYRHRAYESDTTAPAASDAVFLTLTRNIRFGF